MAQGMQVWDPAGTLIFDTNTMTSRILGTIVVTADTTADITVNVPVSTGKTLFWFNYTTGTIQLTVYQGDPANFPNRFAYAAHFLGPGAAGYIFYGEK
jgi:hypothetical protein